MEDNQMNAMQSMKTPEAKSNGTMWLIVLAVVVVVGLIGFMVMKNNNKPGVTVQVNNEGSTQPTPSIQVQGVETQPVTPPASTEPATPVIPAPTLTPQPASPTTPVAPATPSETPKSKTVTFNVSAGNFNFSMNEIKVNKGDTVKINFTNKEGFHDWVIDQFSARTPQIKAGETASVEFVADKAGTFEYYCSVGSHRQMGMKGNLIVQ